jgi:hypothetical protein
MSELEQYFDRTDTPAQGSPVGALVVKVIEKNPGISFEEARTQANALLDKAAGKWRYRLPTVYSPEQMENRRESLRKAFNPLAKAA